MTYLMSRAGGGDIIQLLGIDSETKRTLDARAQGLGVSLKGVLVYILYCLVDRLPRARIPALLILALTKAAESR